jgi:peptide/nickel transport system permease protein
MTDLTADPVLSAKPESRVWKKFRSHRSALLGGILVAFFVIIAIAAPILPIPDPSATD